MRAAALAVALLAFAGCSSGAEPTPAARDASPTSTTSGDVAPDGVCDDAPVPAPRDPGFDRTSSRLTARGDARHGLMDAVSVDGGPAPVAGRFQYGRLRLDLEGERVELWVDDCSPAARFVAPSTSDDDGIVEAELPGLDLAPGRYAVHAVVAGDGTVASSVLTVVPEGTEVTVFDVDGTLTVGDRELAGDVLADFFEELTGDYVPEARAGGAEATFLHAGDDRLVVYLTGRPVWLADLTRQWLEATGMAPGVLRMPARDADAVPTDEGVGAAKRAELERLRDAGLRVLDAYGNAVTDVTAYRGFGLPGARIHMLGPEAPEGVDALGDDFERHNAQLTP